VRPRSCRAYLALVRAATLERPDYFVPIDFPDFNLILARKLHKIGVPTVYYISPQLWAWRRRRVRTIKRLVQRMLVIFPFEEPFYTRAQIPVTFVGHPLVDIVSAHASRDAFLRQHGLDPTRPLVALLPGSRDNELRALLPDLVRTAALIAERVPGVQFVLARAPHLRDEMFEPLAHWTSAAQRPVVLEDHSDEVLGSSDVALIASGTATIQAALQGCPMVVVYRVAPLTYRLGKPLLHVHTYAMVNLVAGRRVVPELMQDEFTPDAAAREAVRVLTDPLHAAKMRVDLADVTARLGGAGASRRAAEEVLAVARNPRPTQR
jgi:lipid-A-disaccharide synthase